MINVKKSAGIITAILLGAWFVSGDVFADLKSPAGEDVDAKELRSLIVEGWEATGWDVAPEPPAPIGTAEAHLVDGRPASLAFDQDNKKSMGLKFQFVYPGYNKVILTPPKEKVVKRYTGTLDENNKPKYKDVPGVELPGKVQAVSVWVLGRQNEYQLEGWIEDWTGDNHIFQFGSLDFVGWKPLSVDIPDSMPQGVESYPQTKTLVFKRFIIRSTPKTSKEEVILFFDSLKVLTDMYDIFFDGAELNYDDADKANKERMKAYQEELLRYSQGKTNQNPK